MGNFFSEVFPSASSLFARPSPFIAKEDLKAATASKRTRPLICTTIFTDPSHKESWYTPAYPSHELFGECRREDFNVLKEVGSGYYGKVYRAEHTKTGQTVALKRINMERQKAVDVLMEECTMNLLDIPAARKHYCSYYDEKKAAAVLVMEYVEGLNLVQIQRTSTAIDSVEAPHLMASVALVLQALHLHGFGYVDLKSANVMVTEKNEVKLIDFGLVRPFHTDRPGVYDQPGGAAQCWPPEYFPPTPLDVFLTAQADWWALAITMFGLVNGGLPYDDGDMQVLRTEEMKKNAELRLKKFGTIVKRGTVVPDECHEDSPEFAELFQEMTVVDPSQRLGGPGTDYVLQSLMTRPWLASVGDVRELLA